MRISSKNIIVLIIFFTYIFFNLLIVNSTDVGEIVSGTSVGNFRSVNAVCIDDNGNVYVSDTNNHRILNST